MSTLCAQVWRRGEWQFTACLNDDHPLGREQLAKEVSEQFPGLPSRLVKEGDDGRLMVIKGACTGGCGCNGRTCKGRARSEEHTSELQSLRHLVCRLLLEKKKK